MKILVFTVFENEAEVEIFHFLYFYFVLSTLQSIYKVAKDHALLEPPPVKIHTLILREITRTRLDYLCYFRTFETVLYNYAKPNHNNNVIQVLITMT